MGDRLPSTTTVCIAGGGPAGMMLGYLLARAGIDVTVLEKHKDFLRDFRGDTVHPSTLSVMAKLGLLDQFLALPHEEAHTISARIGDEIIPLADFTGIHKHPPFVALMPQWDFLNFLADQGRQLPNFHLVMQANVESLIVPGDEVIGVNAQTSEGPRSIRSRLVVGADGRRSVVRAQAQLEVEDIGAPIDVLWMRIPRLASDPDQPLGSVKAGSFFVMLYRDTYWQCAYVIPKGSFEATKQRGLPAFQKHLRRVAPFLADRVEVIDSWDKVCLLTVKVDRLKTWYRKGLLCIGDAAHAMSPVGGVGINLAVQDAVAAANILTPALRDGKAIGTKLLAEIQDRRMLPTRLTQAAQVAIQKRIIKPTLDSASDIRVPRALRLMAKVPLLRQIPAYVVGVGVRPELPKYG